MMKKTFILLAISAICSLFLCYTSEESVKDKLCTKENVYFEIKKAGIKYADVVFAQIMLESNNLKSKLTVTNNNFLGMKLPGKRQTTASGQSRGYAKYVAWQDCVHDYLLYQNHVMSSKKMTRSQYISFIGKKYSECGSYKKRVMRVLKENREFLKVQDSVFQYSTI